AQDIRRPTDARSGDRLTSPAELGRFDASAHSPRPSPRYTAAMIARPTRNDWIALLVLALMWGTSYAFIKLGVQSGGLPTFTLIASRLFIGFVFLATVVAIAREPLPRNPRIYMHLV